MGISEILSGCFSIVQFSAVPFMITKLMGGAPGASLADHCQTVTWDCITPPASGYYQSNKVTASTRAIVFLERHLDLKYAYHGRVCLKFASTYMSLLTAITARPRV